MANDLNRLDLTAKDLAMIEAALHTQKKILSVQSQAGRTGARHKLSELKHLMNRIGRNKCEAPATVSWAQMARSFFAPQGDCSQSR